MAKENKIIHCVCPLNSDGTPKPYTPYIPNSALIQSSPTITTNIQLPKRQSVPLSVYRTLPNSNAFDPQSRPSWYMIHAATATLAISSYDKSICVESKPFKNAAQDKELHSFIVNVLDPIFEASSTISSAVLKLMRNFNEGSERIKLMSNNYIDINLAYAEVVAHQYKTGDLVWIHDYQLLMLPFYLRKLVPSAKIGLSVYAKFPRWEHLKSIYGHKIILQSMLEANHIGFQTDLDAHCFANACLQLLLVPILYPSKQIGVLPSSINTQLPIKSTVMEKAKAIRNMFPNKKIIFCRDTHEASVIRTLTAFTDLLSENRFFVNELILILLSAENVLESQLMSIPGFTRQVNQLFGNTKTVPVHFYHENYFNEREGIDALMVAADLGIFLGYHPSTLITAQEFVMSQHCKLQDPPTVAAPLIVSPESPLMMVPYMNDGGATIGTATEDASDIPGLVGSLRAALSIQSNDAQNQHKAIYNYILENNATACAGRFIQKLIDC